jgi:hypothetical protein
MLKCIPVALSRPNLTTAFSFYRFINAPKHIKKNIIKHYKAVLLGAVGIAIVLTVTVYVFMYYF